MTTALVTGGAGFLGSHLCDYLLDELGHEVVALDDLSGGFLDNVPRGARFVQGSVVDHALLEGLFGEHRFDHVYHLAAYAAEGLSHFIKRFNYENNLIGSVNLINAAVRHGAARFVFTSSIAVYGAGQLPMVETLTPRPEDSYGIAKHAVEQELAISHETFGLDYVVFRPHNVYGERQNIGDRYRNVIGIFMNRLMRGEPLPIFGDGEQQRAFTYVGDVIPAIARSPQVEGMKNQTFNVGSDSPTTVGALARLVIDAMEIHGELTHLPARNEVKLAYADHRALQRVFPAAQKETPLEVGLRRMARWAKQAGERESTAFAEIELWKNMPPSWRDAVKAKDAGER